MQYYLEMLPDYQQLPPENQGKASEELSSAMLSAQTDATKAT